jgi:hypothetical protein
MFIKRNISDRGRKPVVTIRLLVISQRSHDVKKLFKSDESPMMRDFVVIDSIRQFRDFRSCGSISIPKLSTFRLAGGSASVALTTLHENRTWLLNDRLLAHDCVHLLLGAPVEMLLR